MSTEEIGHEQSYVSMLYERLDGMRERAERRRDAALRQSGGTPQARSERESAARLQTEQVTRFSAVEEGLCFGRLDLRDGTRRYIGRIGIFDEAAEYEPLLVDWRAPVARSFYLATAAAPDGVARRRHIRTRGRTVVDVDDEVLDLAGGWTSRYRGLTGEAALLAALDRARTGAMRDIVETIQAEQDAVIRSPLGGVLVVEGGPGTGKTAVALHRAAYLLYTYRDQLAQRGVLVVGPNPTFLRYISQVLPSLAETGVLLRTVGDLYPPVRGDRPEPPEVAEVKGRAVMAGVVAGAVADRQWVPENGLEVSHDGYTLWLPRHVCLEARTRARRSTLPHNLARPIVARVVVEELARQVADRIGVDPYADDPLGGGDAPGDPNLLTAAELTDIVGELARDPGVRAVLDRLWPVLTPRRLLADLYASEDRLTAAAPQLSTVERARLRREPGGGWSAADVPLLDEAAELLGEDDSPQLRRAVAEERARLGQARDVLDILTGSAAHERDDGGEPDATSALDVLDAELLAEHLEVRTPRTAAEHAAADRRWAFGHVIVDEAQEVSPMAWRLLLRRCPSRSMTVVGDLAQTGRLAGGASWAEALGGSVADRSRTAELAVNYRTPAEIMDVAARVLAHINPSARPPRSVRRTGVAPWGVAVPPARLAARLAQAVSEQVSEQVEGEGRLGVIVPAGRLDELGRAVVEAEPGAAVGPAADLTNRVVVLTAVQAKGLEFDDVLVADPDGIVAGSPRGYSDLYVALTRATRGLGVLAPGSLPAPLRGQLVVVR